MADYKRMVSYMYQYENGVKKKNVGFARVEAKGGQCKITLHMQLLGQLDSIFPTYLIQRGSNNIDLIYLGDAVLKNQVMDSRLNADETNVMGSGYGLAQMGGILLFLNDNVFFATEWDDKAIVAKEVLEALNPKTNKIMEQNEPEDLENIFRTTSTEKKEEQIDKTIEKELIKLEEELKTPRYKLPGGWKMVERLQVPNKTDVVRREDKSEERADLGVDSQFADSQFVYNQFVDNQFTDDKYEDNQFRDNQFTENQFKDNQFKDNQFTDNRFKDNQFKDNQFTNNIFTNSRDTYNQGIVNQNVNNQDKNEEIGYQSSGEQDQEFESDDAMGYNSTEYDQVTYETQFQDINNMGTTQQEGQEVFRHGDEEDKSRFESSPSGSSEDNNQDHPTAKRFFENYPRIYPFEDNEVILCVKIEPKDIGLLPQEIWPFSNNSFLMHGFYCYHHLIFAKMKNRLGCRYVIGIPGIFHNREQFMARMFGFESFKSIRKRELKQGDFGYWYLPVTF